ncbi:hypothetical protein ON021_22670, partial [Microcoleus sp. HI-ES]|nr:hypothetical protein [Microcoleus sp. HI-ES]
IKQSRTYFLDEKPGFFLDAGLRCSLFSVKTGLMNVSPRFDRAVYLRSLCQRQPIANGQQKPHPVWSQAKRV